MPCKAKFLGSKEIQTVLKVLKPPRDKLLSAVGLYTGFRISEIIAIKMSDVFTTSNGVRNTLKITRLKKKNTVY
ncbi:MAG: site-specific integrase [Candidatus Obscuribacter sp.]|nr:site-specific integrase [Candidatus Obscuribacter sp.]MBP6592804.1 site-specific integrase [Candidatus Obscuribacter sp.]